jgi:probable HAF family extracellular repeat protein
MGLLPNGTFARPLAINDHTEVVGYGDGGFLGGVTHAFLWTESAGLQDIGTISGDDESTAYGINNLGVIVGLSNSSAANHAFLRMPGGTMHDLGNLGGTIATAYGINNSNEVVGYSYLTGNTAYHAFLWTAAEGMQDLGTLGGDLSYGYAINGSGEIVGWSNLTPGGTVAHGFLWTKAGGMQDIGILPGGNFTSPSAINAAGEVAGTCDGALRNTAFMWTQSGGIERLGTGSGSVANGINDAGVIVGDYADNGYINAYVWTRTEHLQNLNDLIPPNSGVSLTFAYAINHSGQITAESGSAILLTPVN